MDGTAINNNAEHWFLCGEYVMPPSRRGSIHGFWVYIPEILTLVHVAPRDPVPQQLFGATAVN